MIKALFRFLFGKGLIFFIGLLVGVAIFAPWDTIWSMALKDLNRQAQGVAIYWEGIESASFTGAKLKKLQVRWPAYRIHADALDFRLGLAKPLTADIETGPEKLNLAMDWSKTLRLLGGVELGTLLGMNRTAGRVGVDGNVSWTSLKEPPTAAELSMNSPRLTWEGKTTLEQFAFEANLDQTLLNLKSLSFAKPLPVDLAGTFNLNWKELAQSNGEVEGSVEMGGKPQNFSKKGTLGQLLKQVGM